MSNEQKSKSYQQLVVGGDLFAIEAHYRLSQKVQSDQLLLITEEKWELNNLLRSNLSLCRGRSNLQLLGQVAGDLELVAEDKIVPSLFFKDMKFRPFGGRSKSGPLLRGESFFTSSGVDIPYSRLFSFLSDSDYCAKIAESTVECPLKSICHNEESGEWIIGGLDGKKYHGQRLVWADSLSRFGEVVESSPLLNSDFMQFAQSARGDALLMLHFDLAKLPTDQAETLLIPRSMTYDYGHYIGQFVGDEQTGYHATFGAFVDRDQGSSEEVAKMVRGLKRRLDKIFPEFSSLVTKEFISLMLESFGDSLDDGLIDIEKLKKSSLVLVGQNAPLDDQKELSHWGRGFASLEGV
ncbi:MAG: hypothetical protein HN353_05095 [Bdellovibrionales bacterium]|jgi:hypothetical protein|nr:hypothetical protein [Bdellovibrionales bacterium]MBT3524987.1 hypothetical protein [Bdellovibrionales bacterium]MBT7767644.1 hypothetical protein [Bdellovibrionales bacterium]